MDLWLGIEMACQDEPVVKIEAEAELERSGFKEEVETDVGVGIKTGCLVCLKEVENEDDVNNKCSLPLLPGSEGNVHVNRQIWAIFVLRHLLKYPQKNIIELLKRTLGVSLSEWFVLCENCKMTVKQVMVIHEKLVTLTEEFTKLRKEVITKLVSCAFSENYEERADIGRNATSTEISQEIRAYFKNTEIDFILKELDERDSSQSAPLETDISFEEPIFEEHQERSDFLNESDPLYLPLNTARDKKCRSRRKQSLKSLGTEAKSSPEEDIYQLSPQVPNKSRLRSRREVGRSVDDTALKIVTAEKNGDPPSPISNTDEEMEDATANSDEDWPLVNEIDDDHSWTPGSNPPKSKESQGHNCHVCDFQGKTAQGLYIHLKRTHKLPVLNEIDQCFENGVFQCSQCPAKFDKCYKFKRHRLLHRKQGAQLCFTCDICKFVGVSSCALRKHLRDEHDIQGPPKMTQSTAGHSDHNEFEREFPPKRPHTVTVSKEIAACFKNGVYQCPQCPASYVQRHKFTRHRILHQRTGAYLSFTCDICKYVAVSSGGLRKHLRLEHNVKESPKVPEDTTLSNSTIKTIDKQAVSQLTERKRKPKYSCGICLSQRLFTSAGSLKQHLRRHKVCKTPCPKCQYPCDNAAALEIHLRRNLCKRKYEYSCDLCDFKSYTLFLFEAHKEMHKSKGKIYPGTSKKKSVVDIPKKSTKSTLFNCTVCSFKTPVKTSLEGHLEMHKVFEKCEKINGKWKCTLCNILFDGRHKCGHHMRECHSSELGLKSYQCSECDKHYAREYNLKVHVAEVHTKKCQYFCDICGFGAVKPSTFKLHMQNHTKEQVICDFCGTSLAQRSLPSHVARFHKNSAKNCKTIKCKYCKGDNADVTFVTRSLLSDHMKNCHKELYIHKCDQCDSTYFSGTSLQLHQKTKHGEWSGQVECEYCHLKLLNKICLYSHYKICKRKKYAKK